MAGKSKLAIREPVADPGGWWWGSVGAAVASWALVSRVGEPPPAWTWVVKKLCELNRLNVEKLRQWVKSLFLVAAWEKPWLAPGKGPGRCALILHPVV